MNSTNNSTDIGGGGPQGNTQSSSVSVSDIIQIPLLSLTIISSILYIILVLVKRATRANKLNWYTINLCFASILLCIVMIIMCIKRIFDISTSSLPCRLQAFLVNTSTCQLMYAHAVVTISRFLGIVHGNKRFFQSTLFLIGGLLLGWFIAFAVAVPYLLIDSFACSSRNAFLSYYTLVATLIIPVLTVLLFNIRIFVFVSQSTRRVHAEGGNAGSASHTRDMHLLKTMIITFVIFIAGWVPLFISQIFIESFTLPKLVDYIFQVLPAISMLCDIIVLIYINPPIRRFLGQIIRKQQQHQQQRAYIDNTLTNREKINYQRK
ncbi:unnamed protein product [Adineta ricciae]|uniref:G-protein coupled receptors family 1 profile domain-containing protein n=1 Tax=Adineta ricciae TaxID=249248 RepID=A0A814JFZ0_ADIRI|nr:unnamed protein product [Adineta ricciae]CAF1148784.1 unnamed protein product [Adineta ricciae]